uniref:Uncharacterized protein n=1 Tax=Globodera rostochiensis TaxID=31243 RepID=A0A914IFL9_GLORO
MEGPPAIQASNNPLKKPIGGWRKATKSFQFLAMFVLPIHGVMTHLTFISTILRLPENNNWHTVLNTHGPGQYIYNRHVGVWGRLFDPLPENELTRYSKASFSGVFVVVESDSYLGVKTQHFCHAYLCALQL